MTIPTLMSPIIRAASAADLPVLAFLNAEVQELHVANRPDQFEPTRLGDIEGWFAQLLQNPAATVRVAECDGSVVGYVVVLVREKPANPFCPARSWWELDQVGVGQEYRRSGVCRALVQAVMAEATAQNIRELELSSWAFNRDAQHAFQRLGFAAKVVRYELRLPEPSAAPTA